MYYIVGEHGMSETNRKGFEECSGSIGIFDEEEFRSTFVRILCDRKGISYQSGQKMTYQEYKEKQFDKLAKELRDSLDMDKIYHIIHG